LAWVFLPHEMLINKRISLHQLIYFFLAFHDMIGTSWPVSAGYIHPIDATFQDCVPVILASVMFQHQSLIFYIILVLHNSEIVIVHSGIDSLWINVTFRMGWLPFRVDAGHHDRQPPPY
jgi:hypothetical protein